MDLRDTEFGGDQGGGVRDADPVMRVAADPFASDPVHPVPDGDQPDLVAGDPTPAGTSRSTSARRTRVPTSRPEPEATRKTVEYIVSRHREMMFAQKRRVALDNSFSAFIRTNILKARGYESKEEAEEHKAERKKVDAAVARIRRALAKGEPPTLPAGVDEEASAALLILHEANEIAAVPFRKIEDGRRRMMERAVAELPGADFVRSVRGFGLYSAAALVGEAYDIGSYRSHQALWKRLGLAVIDELGTKVRQQKRAGELANLHKFNPARRSVTWNIAETLLRAQSGLEGEVGKTGKERVPREAGPYRAIYDREKEKALAKGHPAYIAHAHAKRVMVKALVKHLYQAWRRDLRERASEFGGDLECPVRDADLSPSVATGAIASDHDHRVPVGDHVSAVAGDPVGRDQRFCVRDADQTSTVPAEAIGEDHDDRVRDADLSEPVLPDPIASDHGPHVPAGDHRPAVAGDPMPAGTIATASARRTTRPPSRPAPKDAAAKAREKWMALARKAAKEVA